MIRNHLLLGFTSHNPGYPSARCTLCNRKQNIRFWHSPPQTHHVKGLFEFGCCLSLRLLRTHFSGSCFTYNSESEGETGGRVWPFNIGKNTFHCSEDTGLGLAQGWDVPVTEGDTLEEATVQVDCRRKAPFQAMVVHRVNSRQLLNLWKQNRAELQEMFNSPGRRRIWRSHKAGSGSVSSRDWPPASLQIQLGAEQ